MNLDRIINMIMRRVLGKLVNRGVDAGIGMASRRGKGGEAPAAQGEMTPEERKRARQARQAAKRAKQAARMTRRMR